MESPDGKWGQHFHPLRHGCWATTRCTWPPTVTSPSPPLWPPLCVPRTLRASRRGALCSHPFSPQPPSLPSLLPFSSESRGQTHDSEEVIAPVNLTLPCVVGTHVPRLLPPQRLLPWICPCHHPLPPGSPPDERTQASSKRTVMCVSFGTLTRLACSTFRTHAKDTSVLGPCGLFTKSPYSPCPVAGLVPGLPA